MFVISFGQHLLAFSAPQKIDRVYRTVVADETDKVLIEGGL